MNDKRDKTLEIKSEKNKDIISKYYEEISVYPLLSSEEEVEMSKRMMILKNIISGKDSISEIDLKSHEQEIIYLKQKITQSNLRLVVSIAKRYKSSGLGLLDLISEGNLGLISAVDHFDYSKGCRFSTYGTWWIKQSIMKAISDKSKDVKLPIHIQSRIKNYSNSKNSLIQKLQREPTNIELSESMHTTVKKVAQVIMLTQDTSSLNAVFENDSSTMLDVIQDVHSPDPFDLAYDTNVHDIFDNVLNKLTVKEKEIITLRYGFNGLKPLTLEETGAHMGLTRERIRQIQKGACLKMSKLKVVKELEVYVK